MKLSHWSIYRTGPKSGDNERAVIPAIMFARDRLPGVHAWCLAIGWWSWGIGIIRTTVEITNKENNDHEA